MLYTQLASIKHTTIQIIIIATLLVLTRFHFALPFLHTVAQSDFFSERLSVFRPLERIALNCRTLIDLVPSLKYDDCCRPWPPFRPLAAYRDASFPPSFRSLPYTRWSVLARHCFLVRHHCRTCRPLHCLDEGRHV
jgi:hypothetical protein